MAIRYFRWLQYGPFGRRFCELVGLSWKPITETLKEERMATDDRDLSNGEFVKKYARPLKEQLRVRVPSIEETKAANEARAEQADRQQEIDRQNEAARRKQLAEETDADAARQAEKERMAKIPSREILEIGDMKARMRAADKKDAENRRLQTEPFPACKVVMVEPRTAGVLLTVIVKIDDTHPACPKSLLDENGLMRITDIRESGPDGQLGVWCRNPQIGNTGVLRSDCSSGIAPRWIFVRNPDKQPDTSIDGGGTVNA